LTILKKIFLQLEQIHGEIPFILNYLENYIQIYPVSEGYLRKIPVERRGKYPELL
jgi:hypothetical protein